ncbi:hypothetical protein GCM10008942_03690 [Rhizomicrobium electricum]|uniref:Uncharacterized protein n=1 Tax=Rhizomicrobium electricum TaxID=480070 RepID=A0ABP3P1Q6_9PROT
MSLLVAVVSAAKASGLSASTTAPAQTIDFSIRKIPRIQSPAGRLIPAGGRAQKKTARLSV